MEDDIKKMELKPCPFCGGKAIISERYCPGISNNHYWVECIDKHRCCEQHNEYRTKARAIEAWNRRKTMTNWISVNDKLPEEYEDVLVYVKNGNINRTWYDGHGFRNATSKRTTWYRPESVTHWMPLPESPKEEEDAIN